MTNTTPKNPMNLNAAYGSVFLDSQTNALLRGQGNYQPPPLFQQDIDRDKAYSQAYNVYVDAPNKLPKLPLAPLPDREALLEEFNKYPYSVGDTGMHPQKPQSWERKNVDNVSNEYTDWASKSVQLDPNSLMNFFFSTENVEYLHRRIISEIKKIRKVDISRQSNDELLIIMRNHYQKALSGWLPQQNEPNAAHPRGDAACSLTERLSRLNRSVIEESVKQILSGLDMYLTYYKDASSLPLPLTRPTYTSMKGSRVLSERVGLYDNPHEATKAITSYNERYNII